ncbi:SUF system NifU family Fe-S cluster assembly protein [Candidatus Roizmanbacteria bacterium]|nr:SUF system NifU family Fe-S cluster assembly protein [Candidatus Roizmanbacteria bacterium]
MSIYQDLILDHYRNPHNFGPLKKATAKYSLMNPLCGDKIEIQVVIKKDTLTAVRFLGEGCVISKASASMLTDFAQGKSLNQLKALDTQFILKMLGVSLSPNRVKCALLPLEVLHKLVVKNG